MGMMFSGLGNSAKVREAPGGRRVTTDSPGTQPHVRTSLREDERVHRYKKELPYTPFQRGSSPQSLLFKVRFYFIVHVSFQWEDNV